MRIPYPERIPLQAAAYFALALFAIQWLEGTALYFCIGCSLFILIATLAFNAAGGLTRASGAYVFFYSMLVVIVGLCYKAFLGEPAQTNLADPHTDIEAYVGSIVAMYAAVIASRRFSRRTGLLENLQKEADMYRASVGCILFGSLAAFGIAVLGESGRQIQTAFGQLNQLIPVGIIVGVIFEIRRSGGTRCTNLVIVIGAAYFFFLGASGFSKQGMIEPLLCWLLPMWAYRYRFSIVQLASIFLATFVIFYYLTPFSQYGRSLVPEHATLSDRMTLAEKLLAHPDETRRAYLKDQDEEAYSGNRVLNYFDKPQGFWDRLQFISVDDALNNYTDQHQTFGLLPIEISLINVVPHFLYPNKPEPITGNTYAHEIDTGIVPDEDTTTGISFSPTAEAYHLEGWPGIFILAPLLWFMLFFVYDSLLGDIRSSPWGLLVLVLLAHAAPEGGITYTVYACSYGVEVVLFCAFFTAWFAPLLGSAVLGPDRAAKENRITLRRAPDTGKGSVNTQLLPPSEI